MRLRVLMIIMFVLICFVAAISQAMAECRDGRILDAGLCYYPCPAGYKGVGPVCWKACPSGYKDDGATCRKDVDIIKKESYGRGVGKPMPCAGETTQADAGLCYKPCNAGYNGKGPVCWKACPSGYKDDGATCRKDAEIVPKESKNRGVGLSPIEYKVTVRNDTNQIWGVEVFMQKPDGYGGVDSKRVDLNPGQSAVVSTGGWCPMAVGAGHWQDPLVLCLGTNTRQLFGKDCSMLCQNSKVKIVNEAGKYFDMQIQKYINYKYKIVKE